MKTRLFNYEVITLVIASCLLSLGTVTLVQVLLSPMENHLAKMWEFCGLSSLVLGMVSGGIFWLIRRFLNRI
jgi:uncharacterized membrane-anchored protein